MDWREEHETSKICLHLPDHALYAEGRSGSPYAVKQVKEEVETYKKNMERNHTKYKIVEQTEQPDGSIIVKIIKQYNAAPVGNYLN